MSIEAMKQALEALDLSNPRFGIGTAKHISATAALRQAIAEAEKQEPVAYIDHADGAVIWKQEKPAWGSVLYTHPQPKREPLTNENPLLVFAKECVLGAYREDELADAAFKAIEAYHGIKEKNT